MTRTPSKQKREDFWYAIPGAWMGSANPFKDAGVDCYIVVDADKLAQAFEYFHAHRRTVRITETHVSSRETNGVHITYSWLADLQAEQDAVTFAQDYQDA